MKLADKIKFALLKFAPTSGYDIVIPNCYHNRYEMDVLKLTVSGQLWEYEIKISRSDFNNDAKKSWDNGKTKHDTIIAGERCNRFYFVVPKGLVSIDEVPKFAGLIYYIEGRLEVVKVSPLIKAYKDPPSYVRLAQLLASREQVMAGKYRYERHKLKQFNKVIERLKEKYPKEILLYSLNTQI